MSLLYKDIDLYIAYRMHNNDILSLSIVNKYYYKLFDNFFFKNLISNRYIIDRYDYNDNNDNKRLFVFINYCINKLCSEYDYIFEYGNPITQYDIVNRYCYTSIYDDPEFILKDSVKENQLALVKSIFNINYIQRTDTIQSCLDIAVSNNNFDILKYLVETQEKKYKRENDENNEENRENNEENRENNEEKNEENIKDVNNLYFWAFISACKLGNIKIVKYLIEHNAKLNYGYNSPITFAAINNHIDIVKLLLQHNVTISDMSFVLKEVRKFGYNDIADLIVSYNNNK